MNEHDATELAYKNGYKKGTKISVLRMHSEIQLRCLEKGLYPVLVARVIEDVSKEILGEIDNDE